MANKRLRAKPWKRSFYGALIGLCATVLVGVLFLLWYTPAPQEITVSGTPSELGTQFGQAFKTEIKLLNRFYLDRVLCNGDERKMSAARAKASEVLLRWPYAYMDELTAAAKACGVDAGTLAYANSFLDLGHVQAGCRSLVIGTTNHFLHAHNLDWENLGGLGRWTTCIVRRNPAGGRFRTVAVSFPGMVGALDIINEHGVALSFNQMGVGKGQVTEPVLIMLRRVAETCADFTSAYRELTNAPRGMPFIITVSEARSSRAAVFERIRDTVTVRELQNGWVAACNVNQGTNVGRTSLDQLLLTNAPTSVASVQAALADPLVLMACNIYSVIFDFRNNKLLVASGSIPAAHGKIREFTLFDRD